MSLGDALRAIALRVEIFTYVWREGMGLASEYERATEPTAGTNLSLDFTEGGYDDAEAAGLDAEHIAEDLLHVALCITGGDLAAIDRGIFVQLTDQRDRVWTFTVITPTTDLTALP